MRTELIVAEKEFKDHLTSKRFIAVFAIMMLLSVYGIINGLSDYDMLLDSYKSAVNSASLDPNVQQIITSLQNQISDAKANGASAEDMAMLQSSLDQYLNPVMPGLSVIFYKFSSYFLIVGIALSVSLGFNMISREKEDDSLKLLLSRPIYRDAIINGKILGAIAVILLILVATFLITMAVLLVYGIIPTFNDLAAISVSFVNMGLYCLVFLGISVLVSALVKNSTNALILIIMVVFLLYMVMELSGPLTDFIVGPSPLLKSSASSGSDSLNTTGSSVQYVNQSELLTPEFLAYYNNRMIISETTNFISPMYNYYIITNAIISNEKPYLIQEYNPNPTIFDLISLTWINLLSMIVEIIATLSVSYILFMRMDA